MLKNKINKGQSLLGTFVKTPSHIIIEVLADSGLDFMILDAEHAPFDRQALDVCIMAAKLKGCPVIVRLFDDSPSSILNALDLGADGICVPHVKSKQQAKKIVQLAHYGTDGRGYAGSTRAAGYGDSKISEHLETSKRDTFVMLQIEDPEAVDDVDAIAAVNGVDSLFIGRVDLAVGYNTTDFNDPNINQAIDKVCSAAKNNKLSIGIFLPNLDEYEKFKSKGILLYAMASEHQMIKHGFRVYKKDDRW